MTKSNAPLHGVRVISALNGLDLFGHERGNITVYKALCDMGADVFVGVNAKEDNHVEEELNILKIPSFSLPFGPQWSKKWIKKHPLIVITYIKAVIRCNWLFFNAVRKYKPTHIHLGSSLVYSYLYVALMLRNIPLIYRMGDCPPDDSPFNLRIWKMTMRRCKHVVANSNYVRRTAIIYGLNANKVSVIYNLVPERADSNKLERHTIEGSHCSYKLIYIGQLAEHKGLLLLIDAVHALKNDFQKISLDILGGSRYDTIFREKLFQLILEYGLQDKVVLHGYVKYPKKYFNTAAIHVLPSIWEEPSANVVLEAKSESVPSVVFPSGGSPEMVRHKIDGYICEERSTNALIKALQWMLSDTERLKEMGAAALNDSTVRFGRVRYNRAWENVYHSHV